MFLENKTEEFKIPLEEHYRCVPFERYVKVLESNVYKGYNISMITDDFRSTSERLFYPDYIVYLKGDTIWLIETKDGEKQGQSKNIDIQIENKFEAFKQFANKHKYKFGFVRDKDDEPYLNNTEYVDNMNDCS